jgi:tetratricopeptide (TPR) repeat protein
MSSELEGHRERAWAAFQAGEFDAAIASFHAALESEMPLPAELLALVEVQADRNRHDVAIDEIDRALQRWRMDEGAELSISWRVLQFDLALRGGLDDRVRKLRALDLLEVLGAAEKTALWDTYFTIGRRAEIESTFETPLERLSAYELEACAPPRSPHFERAVALIEELGVVHAKEAAVARPAERLLHAIGNTAAAYRVERARRAAEPPKPAMPSWVAEPDELDLGGRFIVLAGGHPALRALIARDLMRSGAARIDAIPSATEAIRSGRDVQAAMAGADAAVLLVRQIAHSTSDQVKRAGKRAGVPVVVAESAGISGVRRALSGLTAFGSEHTIESKPSERR